MKNVFSSQLNVGILCAAVLFVINGYAVAEPADDVKSDEAKIKICTRWDNKRNSNGQNFPTPGAYDNLRFSLSTPKYAIPSALNTSNSNIITEEDFTHMDPKVEGKLPIPSAAEGTGHWNCQEYGYSTKEHPSFAKDITLHATLTDKLNITKMHDCSETGCTPYTEERNISKEIYFAFKYNDDDYKNDCRIAISWVPSNANDLGHYKWARLKGNRMAQADVCTSADKYIEIK
jgi:hypothetical protein